MGSERYPSTFGDVGPKSVKLYTEFGKLTADVSEEEGEGIGFLKGDTAELPNGNTSEGVSPPLLYILIIKKTNSKVPSCLAIFQTFLILF